MHPFRVVNKNDKGRRLDCHLGGVVELQAASFMERRSVGLNCFFQYFIYTVGGKFKIILFKHGIKLGKNALDTGAGEG